MGCCSSKADADQPKKTIIIQQAEPVQHIIPLDNPTTSIINERQRIQIEEEDRARREALERAESKKRGALIKTPPKSKHAKLLALVDDKYKNLQSLLILLHENLKKHDKEDKELATLNQKIKSDSKEIEGAIDDLQAQSFPNDKEYVKDLRKIVLVSKNLDLEYQSLKKKNKKYPEYKKTILGTLNDQYAELFDESKTQGSMRRSEFSVSPKSELRTISERKTSPSRNFHDGSLSRDETYMVRAGEPGLMPQHMLTVSYDDPFDREMANVVQKQKDDVAFELDTAVHEYERLQMDFNVLKARQEILNKDYRATQQEIKELQDANKQISTRNNAMGAENGSFKENKTEVLRKHEHTKQACAALENELAELRALYIQRVAEGDLIEQEHEFRVSQLEYEIKRKQEEAREIEKNRKEEELKLREEERRCLDDERRREEHERKRREVERKRQDDERRHLEEDKMRKEELRRVEARIAEVDRQRRSQMLEQLNPAVDFSTSVPLVREVRTSIPIAQTVSIGVPTMLPPLHPDSREAERKLQEDIRRIQMMNEEADRKRAHMIQQLSMPVTVEVPPPNMPIVSNPLQYSSPVRFEDIVLPTKYTSMQLEPPVVSPFVVLPVEAPAGNFIVQEPVIMNGGRRSIYVDHDRSREFPRRSVTVERPQPKFVDEGMKKRAVDDHMQGRRTEGVSSALDMARKARMGMDRSQVAAAMDHKRLEAQNVPINYQSGFGY